MNPREGRAGLPIKLAMLAVAGLSAVGCESAAQAPRSAGSGPAITEPKEASTAEGRAVEFGRKIVNLFMQKNYTAIKAAYLPEDLRDMQAADKYFDYHLTVIADNYAKCENTGHPLQLDKPQTVSKKQPNGDVATSVTFPFAGGECLASGIDISGRAVPWHLTHTNFIVTERGGKPYLSLVQ